MKDSKLLTSLKNKSKVIIAWVTVFLFFFLSFWSGWKMSLIHASLLTLCLLLASNIESKFIIKLLQNGNIFLFYFINFFFVIIMSFLTTYIESFMLMTMSKHFAISTPQLDGIKVFVFPFLIRIVLFMATIVISVISYLQRTEKENQRVKNELKSEKLDMELRFLKSQITPHFLFNALNNIYSLVYIKDEKASQSVLELSDMLRYVMVDSQVELISLEKEIAYIDTYIDFQLMCMENKSNVIFEKKIMNYSFVIPPMILQPLVENSFKHSRVVNDPEGYVHFYLLQENNSMMFIARNSVKGMSVSVVDNNKKQPQGIGVSNVKKRLELYYGKDFSFEIKQEDDSYVTIIKIGNIANEKKV